MNTALTKTKILIVDSNESNLAQMSRVVSEEFDHSMVYTATGATEALSKISNDKINVLIVSMELPKMSGSEMLKQALRDANMKQAAIIGIAHEDNNNEFNNEIIVGRMELLQRPVSEDRFKLALIRARNYVSTTSNSSELKTILLSPGEFLCRQGEKAHYAYYVKRGVLQATAHGPEGAVVLGEIKHDEFVGEMAHLASTERTADVVAVTSSELIEIPLAALDAILFAKPAWARAMMKTLSKRVMDTNKKVPL